MKRISKVVLWGGLAFTLAIGVTPAQSINEIVRGAANGQASDIFGCGKGNSPCDLGYKLYCELDPSDTLGSGNPSDGIPSYRNKAQRYLADVQITANYPVCGNSGPGNDWFMIWDGQTDGGSSAHAGWYGAQAQKINFGEIGNSLSFNCLPVIGAEACFAALDDVAGTFNDTVRRDGSALNHIGGLSPVPVPQFEARIDSIAAIFENPSNKTFRDGAGDPIAGINLYWMLDDANATDLDWAASGQLLATLPSDATEYKLLRSDPFIRDGKEFMLATQLVYAGGIHSSYFSANSGTFSELQDLECVTDPNDAPDVVDIEQICFAVRKDDFGKEFLIVLLDIVGAPAGQVLTSQVKYEVTMNTTGDPSARNNRQIRANALNPNRLGSGPTVLRFNTNFDNTGEPDRLLSENSTYDEAPDRGWILFGVPLAELADSFGGGSITGEPGTRTVTFSGTARVPDASDVFPNGGGAISYTF